MPLPVGLRRRRRQSIGSLVGWTIVAVWGVVLVTQVAGVDGIRHVAALQALTPYSVWMLAPVAVVMLRDRRHLGAALASTTGIGVLVLAAPLVFPSTQAADEGATGVRVGVVNLLYTNDRTTEIADELAGRDLDVVVFTELTDDHLDRLLAHDLADRFPHRTERPGPLATGVGIWSRWPLTIDRGPDTANRTIDATIEGPDGPFRLLGVHPPTPVYDFDGWRDDLAAIGETMGDASRRDEPTLVAGDFNASYWHPRFRDLLDLGYTDAHIALGHGWSTSWPTDVVVPPYVRLDHALAGGGLVATDVEDFRVAGSDHTGFVVTVAPARRTAP